MNADKAIERSGLKGKYEALTHRVIGVFFEVHRELGHGFLESVIRNVCGLH